MFSLGGGWGVCNLISARAPVYGPTGKMGEPAAVWRVGDMLVGVDKVSVVGWTLERLRRHLEHIVLTQTKDSTDQRFGLTVYS